MRLKQWPGIVTIVSFCLGSCLLLPIAAAETAPTKVLLGTATKGGGFQLFGQHLVEAINDSDTNVVLEEVTSKGSKENVPFLEAGKIDIGLVEGNAAHEILEGMDATPSKLKVLAVMYPNPGMFVVRADSAYQTIADLKGKPIAFGTRASGLRILARDVLDGIGLHPEKDFQQVLLEKAGDGPRMVLNKEVEALWGAGIGWPGFVKVADSEGGARFIAPAAAQVKKILAKHPHLKPMTVPANTYRGQTQDIHSLGLWSVIMVRPDLADETVYQLARAIHGAESNLAQRLAQGSYTTAKNSVAHVAVKHLHPAAARYYRDSGLLAK